MKLISLIVVFMITVFTLSAQEMSDVSIFQTFMEYAKKENLKDMKNCRRIEKIAKYFINTPYVGGTLEADGPEKLQVNLRGLDCTTFVENVLALNLTIKSSSQDFDTFKSKLRFIRYRDGVLNGYPSRLHYASDWIYNNHKKGLVKVVSTGKVSSTLSIKVDYMSTHPESYPALKNNPDFVSKIAENEKQISHLVFKYVPKNKVDKVNHYIRTGDIIAITTNIAGLDFSHLGFAIVDGDEIVLLLHASSTFKKVMLSNDSLFDYLAGVKRHSGIVIVRPL